MCPILSIHRALQQESVRRMSLSVAYVSGAGSGQVLYYIIVMVNEHRMEEWHSICLFITGKVLNPLLMKCKAISPNMNLANAR